MPEPFHSLRMHASREGEHISGGERLLRSDQLEEAAIALFRRALQHPRGQADKIHINLEQISAARIHRATLLPVTSHEALDWKHGRVLASELLVQQGLSREVVSKAISCLADGASPGGGVMRGAVLMDAETGQRLEPDALRGVRVSRMDLADGQLAILKQKYPQLGSAFQRFIEALLLASKVATCRDVLAELCWSDDPDYLTGYVASSRYGYQRLSPLKAAGDSLGGRVFFLRRSENIKDLIEHLQHEAVLFSFAGDGGSDHEAD